MWRLISAFMMIVLSIATPARSQVEGVEPFLVEAGDRIQISVLEDPSLNTTTLVRPDGVISLPIAGSLQAAGRTPETIAAAIRRALARSFVEPPTVTVVPVNIADRPSALITVYIMGEIGRPGRLDLEGPATLLQALAQAGGPGIFAATQRIQVRRMIAGNEEVLLFDYDLIEEGSVPTNNIQLMAGDIVVVPERAIFE